MISFLKKHYLLILILLVASFLRLYRIGDYTEFLGDQGRDAIIYRDLFKNGNFFFIGPQTSIGNMYTGPFYYYLVAPSLWIANFNPVGPAVFIALLGILSVYLVYHVASRWFNRPVGLVSAFLFAISPVAVKYSGFSWNPNVMPLFALLFVYFLWLSFNRKRYGFLIPATLSFIMAVNSHYIGLVLLPLGGLYFLLHLIPRIKSKQNISKLIKLSLVSLVIFSASLIPQIAFDIKHDGQLSKAMITFFTYRETTVNLKAYKSIPVIPSLYNQINTSLLGGRDPIFGFIAGILILLPLVALAYSSYKKKKLPSAPILLAASWYFTGLVGLGLYKQHIYDHYFGFLFPVVFILAGFSINWLWQQKLALRFVSVITLSLLTYTSLANTHLRYPGPRQIATTKAISQFILIQSNNEPFNLGLIAKQNYDPPYRYFMYENNAPLFDANQKITDQLFVICEPWQVTCEPVNHPEYSIAAFGWSRIDKEWEINGIKIFRLVKNTPNQDPESR